MTDMGPMMEIAKEYDIAVIDDFTQAIGAEYGLRPGM